jgi:hypothetical protein
VVVPKTPSPPDPEESVDDPESQTPTHWAQASGAANTRTRIITKIITEKIKRVLPKLIVQFVFC